MGDMPWTHTHFEGTEIFQIGKGPDILDPHPWIRTW